LVGAASQSDPLESMPLVILSLAAVAAIVVGVIVTTVAFAPRRAGRSAEPK
jgi:hypothetical protein